MCIRDRSNVFQYEITVDNNLIPKKCEIEESIIFCKNDNKENVIASIDMPFMNDKTGKAYSDDITYDIEKSKYDDNKYILTMTLSQDYLNDKDRVYPCLLYTSNVLEKKKINFSLNFIEII